MFERLNDPRYNACVFRMENMYIVFSEGSVLWMDIPKDAKPYFFPIEPIMTIRSYLKALTEAEQDILHTILSVYDFSKLTEVDIDYETIYTELQGELGGDHMHLFKQFCVFCQSRSIALSSACKSIRMMELGFTPGRWSLIDGRSVSDLFDIIVKNGTMLPSAQITDPDELAYWEAILRSPDEYLLRIKDSIEPDSCVLARLHVSTRTATESSKPKVGLFDRFKHLFKTK